MSVAERIIEFLLRRINPPNPPFIEEFDEMGHQCQGERTNERHRGRTVRGLVVALMLLTACGSFDGNRVDIPGDVDGTMVTACHDGYAFAVYDGFRAGGLTRFPEMDHQCEETEQ